MSRPTARPVASAVCATLSVFMRPGGRHRAWLVGGWLLAQAAFLTATPLGLCVASALFAPADECTCAHEDGQACPMHPVAGKSTSSCSCRSTTDPSAIVVASLMGPLADIPAATALAQPLLAVKFVSPFESSPIE